MDRWTEARIKDTARIVEVVGDYVELRKRGVEYEGLCPFHNDRHLGSFKVSPAKNICTCFSCGATYDPVGFIMAMEKVSYPDALGMLAKRCGIAIDSQENIDYQPVRREAIKLPMLVMSNDIVRATIGGDTDLTRWLRSLPWSPVQRARVETVLRDYAIGSRGDRVVFWQVDEQGRVRTGKVMKYMPDGHRDKAVNPGWMHNQPGIREQLDLKNHDVQKVPFGLHLLNRYPEAAVNIVESEKTALVCAIAYGNNEQYLWMALGGKNMLSRDRLESLIKAKRRIYLWPDKDAINAWRDKANKIGVDNIKLYTNYLVDWREGDGPKADVADIIIRQLQGDEGGRTQDQADH